MASGSHSSNSPSLRLSRLPLFDFATWDTPDVVLIETAKCHGIDLTKTTLSIETRVGRHNLITTINSTPVSSVTRPFNNQEKIIAVGKYVNPEVTWPLNKLEEAFEFLWSFRQEEQINQFVKDIDQIDQSHLGSQTPENPKMINSCVLYGVCYHLRLKTNSKTTPLNMLLLIKTFKLNYKQLQESLIALAHGVNDPTRLINAMISLDPTFCFNTNSGIIHQLAPPSTSVSTSGATSLTSLTTLNLSPSSIRSERPQNTYPTVQPNYFINPRTGSSRLSPTQTNRSDHLSGSPPHSSSISPGFALPLAQALQPVSSAYSRTFGSINNITGLISQLFTGGRLLDAFSVGDGFSTLFGEQLFNRENTRLESSFPSHPHDLDLLYISKPIMPTYEQLEEAGREIGRFTGNRFTLDTPAKYIAYAFLGFDYDLRNDLHRLKDAMIYLTNHPDNMEEYQPYYYQSRYIKRVFDPNIPQLCYHPLALEELIVAEGFSARSIPSIQWYETLQTACLTSNFHWGKSPSTETEETFITREKLSDLRSIDCMSFGVRGTPMKVFTIEEILLGFRSHNAFKDLSENSLVLYPDHVIQKLSLLLQQGDPNVPASDPIYQQRGELLGVIKQISQLDSEIPAVVRQFKQLYQDSSAGNRRIFRGLLLKLNRLGMIMRTWSGSPNESYPLTCKECKIGDRSEELINQRSEDYLLELNQYFERLSSNRVINTSSSLDYSILIDLFKSLPIYRSFYSENKIHFRQSRDQNVGRTIKERLYITAGGNVTSNINSCIRMSSNYFTATAYYYWEILNEVEKVDPIHLFDITRLEWIS